MMIIIILCRPWSPLLLVFTLTPFLGEDFRRIRSPLRKNKTQNFTQRECCVPPCVAGGEGGFTLITFLVQTFAPVPSDLGLVGAHHGEPGFFVERNYWPGIFRPAMGPPFQTTIVGNQVWMSWPRMVRPKSRPKKKQRTEDDSDEPTTGGCDVGR